MNVDQSAQIEADFGKYMHPFWGVVGMYPAYGEDKATFTCDNYHMFTALYFRMLTPLPGDVINYNHFLNSCHVVQGLYARFPGRITDISQDEIYGMCSIGPGFSNMIELFGSDHWWSYNLTTPGKFTLDTFLGRFPCFTGYVKTTAQKFMWLWGFYWFFGFIASSFTNESETSGKLLSYLQIPVMSQTYLGKLAILIWRWKMKRTYPGGIKQVCGIYFPAGHPFTIHAPENFE